MTGTACTAPSAPLSAPLAGPGRRVGVGTAFGTFGELLQGQLAEPDGDFLVTLPIARWATAVFDADRAATEVTVEPRHKCKSARLATLLLRRLGVPGGGSLRITSRLPEGKGMASSSADLVATARAVANAVGRRVLAPDVEALLRRIEPTDGVLHDGIVAYHHRGVRLRARLGSLPPLTVVGIDEGGEVDTIAFNRLPKPFTATDHREYSTLLHRMAAAVAHGDLADAGAVATRSLELNQRLNPKRLLGELTAVSAEYGGLGVVGGHSGTTIGVLLDPTTARFPDVLAAVAQRCCALAGNVTVHRTLGAAPAVAAA